MYVRFTIGGSMKCVNCKVNVSNSDKYCPRCGTLFNNGDVERLVDTLENNLLNIYVSKKRFNSNISLGYLIFNFWYALYKKMYFEAIFGAIADGVLILMIMNWKNYLISSIGFYALLIMFLFMLGIVVNVYYILKFNELYIIKVKGYINKIIRENGTDDIKRLESMCEKDSRGNLVGPILIILGIIIFFLSLLFKNIAFLPFCGII